MLRRRTVIILCKDKYPLLKIDGDTFLDILLDKLSSFEEILICTNEEEIKSTYGDIVEVILNSNIKEGLLTAMLKSRWECSLVLNVNMPLVKEVYINKLGKYDFNEEVLCSFYKGKENFCCGVYKNYIAKKYNSYEELRNKGTVRYIFPRDEEQFLDVKGKGDYLRVCSINQGINFRK